MVKGQLISKFPFGVIVWTKIPTIFLRISALACKKSSNQKKSLIKSFSNNLKKIRCLYLFFCSTSFYRIVKDLRISALARTEIFKKFRWYFGQNDDTKRTFWNKLDFSHETTNATSGNHPSWQQLGTLLGNKVLKKFPNKSWSSSLIFFKWKKKKKNDVKSCHLDREYLNISNISNMYFKIQILGLSG